MIEYMIWYPKDDGKVKRVDVIQCPFCKEHVAYTKLPTPLQCKECEQVLPCYSNLLQSQIDRVEQHWKGEFWDV